ncbi:amino acid ABC transporter permease [uncultured Selenomonas sp.]|uniref:amino acid ABC transporter permease n=1 Tax=uncultured Selenomonas sp. TaxID=159275 RepID=UPI0028DC3897|nr:amino acid ABC transporter permease [uncultured Selenomonas sp.]
METRAFDIGMIAQVLPDLLTYLDVTLLVALVSIALGSLLGGLLAWANLSGTALLRWAALSYVYVMRCTPSIVLLFIVFYGLPKLMEAAFRYDMNELHRAVFAIITFTLLFSAYISEVFRAAYTAVPRGQYEAAVSAGLTSFQAFRHVILGQAALVALPNFGNATINLLKEGSLAYTIGLIDMIGKGNLIIAQNFGAYGIEVYLAALLIYWVLVLLLEQVVALVEKRLDVGTSLRAADTKEATGRGGDTVGVGS